MYVNQIPNKSFINIVVGGKHKHSKKKRSRKHVKVTLCNIAFVSNYGLLCIIILEMLSEEEKEKP